MISWNSQPNTSPSNQHTKPSYANIARRAPERPLQQPKAPKKAPTLPESVKLAPKSPKPIKIGLQKPTKETPSELIHHIKERAVNGERLTGLIKAFKTFTPRTLLVYSTIKSIKEELE